MVRALRLRGALRTLLPGLSAALSGLNHAVVRLSLIPVNLLTNCPVARGVIICRTPVHLSANCRQMLQMFAYMLRKARFEWLCNARG
ncbi:exported hypothetical protein [Pseudomonas sp. 8Z]|nr:exported hypothetical protein [Pseudomonas sp. 8Z]